MPNKMQLLPRHYVVFALFSRLMNSLFVFREIQITFLVPSHHFLRYRRLSIRACSAHKKREKHLMEGRKRRARLSVLESVAIKIGNWLARKVENNKMRLFMQVSLASFLLAFHYFDPWNINVLCFRFYQKKKLLGGEEELEERGNDLLTWKRPNIKRLLLHVCSVCPEPSSLEKLWACTEMAIWLQICYDLGACMIKLCMRMMKFALSSWTLQESCGSIETSINAANHSENHERAKLLPSWCQCDWIKAILLIDQARHEPNRPHAGRRFLHKNGTKATDVIRVISEFKWINSSRFGECLMWQINQTVKCENGEALIKHLDWSKPAAGI